MRLTVAVQDVAEGLFPLHHLRYIRQPATHTHTERVIIRCLICTKTERLGFFPLQDRIHGLIGILNFSPTHSGLLPFNRRYQWIKIIQILHLLKVQNIKDGQLFHHHLLLFI